MRRKTGRSTDLVRAGPPPLPPGSVVFERVFPADTPTKNQVLEELLKALQASGALRDDSDEIRMRLCLDEALVNAVMHGSNYDATKSVTVRVFHSPAKWSLLIEDEGAGFREEDLPDPNAPENLLEESGRGVHLIRTMMDEVSYWRGGRALLMSRMEKKS